MTTPNTHQLSTYSLLAIPLAFGSLPLYLFLPDFYARELGVSLAAMGVALLAIRLVDAVVDPFLGFYARKLGGAKLLRMMMVSLCVLGGGLLLLVSPPDNANALLWFIALMLLTTTAISLVTIIYHASGATWSEDYHAKTRITSWREGFMLLGVIVAVSLPDALRRVYSEREAFLLFGAIFVILLTIGGIIWRKWAQQHLTLSNLANTPFHLSVITHHRRFFAVWFLGQLASAIPVVTVLFFIRDKLQLADHTGFFLLLYFLSGALGMPLWRLLEARSNKRFAWGCAMALSILTFIWAALLGAGDAVGYGIICILSGLALGGEMALPPSILADRMQAKHQETEAAVLFGMAGFIGKASLALASGVMLPLLAWYGYQPDAVNSPNAIASLSIAYAIIPCAVKAAALLLLFRSPLAPRS